MFCSFDNFKMQMKHCFNRLQDVLLENILICDGECKYMVDRNYDVHK